MIMLRTSFKHIIGSNMNFMAYRRDLMNTIMSYGWCRCVWPNKNSLATVAIFTAS